MANYNNAGPVNPIYGFPFITSYSPVIPKLYWGVSSQEQRILEICQAVDELGKNLYDTANTVNNLLDEMVGVSNKIVALDKRLTAVEAGDHTGGGGTADGSIGDRVTKLEQTTTTQGNTISSIDGRVTTNASGIAGLVSSTNALGDRVTALENASGSDPNGLAGRVTALENDNTSNKTSIKANADAISGHDTRLNTIEQQVSDQKGINTSVDGKIKTINDKIASMDSELSDTSLTASTASSNASEALSTATDASSKVTAMDKRVTTNATNISGLQDSVNSLNGKVSTNTTDITTLKNNAATDEKNITNLQDSLKTTNTTVDGLTKDLKTARTDIDGNKTAIADAKTSIGTLSDNLSKTNTDLDTANEAITDVKNRVSDTEKSITDVKTSISDTNKNVKANSDAITSATDSVKALSEKTDGISSDLKTAQTNISALQGQQGTNTHDISELKTNDAGNQKAISSLQGQMTGAVGDIANLQKRVGDLENEAANQPASRGLQSRQGISEYVLTRDTNPDQPETPDINNIAERLVTVEEGVGNLTTRADTMDRWGKSIETRVKALEDKKPGTGSGSDDTELANRVTAVESDLTTAKKDISDLKADVGTSKTDISALQTSSEDYGKRIKALENAGAGSGSGSDNTELAERVTAVEGSLKTAQENITTNTASITTLTTDLGTVKSDVDSLKTSSEDYGKRIKTLEDKPSYDDTALAGRVTKTENDISSLQTNVNSNNTNINNHETRLHTIETDLYDHKDENGSTIQGQLGSLTNGVRQAFGAIDEINTSLLGYYDPDKKESVPGLNQLVMNGWTDSSGTKHSPMTDRVDNLETSSEDYGKRIKALEDKPAGGDTSALESRMTDAENNIKNAVYRLDNVVNGGQGSHGKFEDVLEECRVAVRDYLSTMYNVYSTSSIPDKSPFNTLGGLWNILFKNVMGKQPDSYYRYNGFGLWQYMMKTQYLINKNRMWGVVPDGPVSIIGEGRSINPLHVDANLANSSQNDGGFFPLSRVTSSPDLVSNG